MAQDQGSTVKPKKEKVKKDKKKGGKATAFEVDMPRLVTPEDSISYIFGVWQASGLKQYMIQQLDVDTTYLADFMKGVMEGVSVDPADKQQFAYLQGLNIAKQIQDMNKNFSNDYYSNAPGKQLDAKVLAQSILVGLQGKSTLSADSAQLMFREKMEDRHKQNKESMYGVNRLAGEKFLEENKLKEGVVTLPSGLQYKILTQGDGPKPQATDKVKVNYEGRLIDGKVFDSSYKRNEPAVFQCNQVIAGWTEALTMMPVGSKWELYIPYQLAYGEREAGQDIKPYSMLIFTVDLLSIEK